MPASDRSGIIAHAGIPPVSCEVPSQAKFQVTERSRENVIGGADIPVCPCAAGVGAWS